MDFRVVNEIKVVRTVVKHVLGPCMMCDRETEYRGRVPWLGMAWLRKHFEPGRRRKDIRVLRLGLSRKAVSLSSLEMLLCPACSARLPTLRQEACAERDDELLRRGECYRRWIESTTL